MRFAMFEGIGKPMPTEPPEFETVELLMPASLPSDVTSAPPELPGLGGGRGSG